MENFIAIATLTVLLVVSTKLMNITAYPLYELADQKSQVAKLYGSAYTRLAVKRGFCALNFFTWFLLRRFAVVLFIVFLQDYPGIQITLHILLGFIDVGILCKARPFS